MSLAIGHKLAHYEILEPTGKGGMGEVYRAHDSKLGRDVAIKVLPDEFAQEEERLRRFQREPKVLASLNHPNIAAIYGLEQSGSTHFLPYRSPQRLLATGRRQRGGRTTPDERASSDSFVVVPDGNTLTLVERSPTAGHNINVLSLEGDRTPEPFLHTDFTETRPVFSPDGQDCLLLR